MCTCGQNIKTTTHFFHCPNHNLHKENPPSKDISYKWQGLRTDWFNDDKDSTIQWQQTRFWNKMLLMSTNEFTLSPDRGSCPLIE